MEELRWGGADMLGRRKDTIGQAPLITSSRATWATSAVIDLSQLMSMVISVRGVMMGWFWAGQE